MEIPLTNSDNVAVIDFKDWPKIHGLKFRLNRQGYAVTTTKAKILLHLILLGKAPRGKEWDHEDRDKLNNRRLNLRAITHLDNTRNRSLQINNTSGFRGVSWYRRDSRWRAQIKIRGHKKFLGLFDSKYEAAFAYNEAAEVAFRQFAVLNDIPRFPRRRIGWECP
jgi:HNH endonuclease/AP2 domain